MKHFGTKTAVLVGVLTLALLPSIGLADHTASHSFPQPAPHLQLGDSFKGEGPKGIIGFLEVIANWFFALLITISVIYILIAAYTYMSSQGGEGVGDAHKMLMYAAVGIAVAVLARGIVFAIRKLVDSDTKPAPAASMHYEQYHS